MWGVVLALALAGTWVSFRLGLRAEPNRRKVLVAFVAFVAFFVCLFVAVFALAMLADSGHSHVLVE